MIRSSLGRSGFWEFMNPSRHREKRELHLWRTYRSFIQLTVDS